MDPPDARLTFLRPVGYQIGDCGYCKQEGSSASYYVVTKSLRPEHYQIMMDRGWRRSGTLMYLPDAARSCCPHYTIRLPVFGFRSSRDHRQALHRWNRFVLGEDYITRSRRSRSREAKRQANQTFDLHQTVHEAEMDRAGIDPFPEHQLIVTLEEDSYTDEKFDLFADYQQHVHHEEPAEITKSGFKRFLCESPLHRTLDSNGKQLGSYHHCYRLDGRLIAMSVLDLLPHAVSGVYFIYHQDFEKYSMGKLSALREIALAGECDYENYYMGYYIHGCEKMKYKGTYKQQYVLDYENLNYDPLDERLLSLMSQKKYVSLSKETAQEPTSYEYEAPSDAVNSARSLLDIGMPGVMTLETMQASVEYNKIWLYLRRGQLHQMEELTSWEEGDDLDSSSLRGVIAEYAACVGPAIAAAAIIDFSG